MRLDGVNVLVDGYNLELRHGTGVKTYAISTIRALLLLGAKISTLFSSSSSSSDPVLNEILFYDSQANTSSKTEMFLAMVKYLSGFTPAKRVSRKKIVVVEDEVKKFLMSNCDILNLPHCYKVANYLYSTLGIETKIAILPKVDIWHSTYPLPIKIKKAKRITTIHDLVPLRLPYTTLDNKKIYYKLIKNCLKKSDLIITVSNNSKKDIQDIFDISSDRITVTYQPITLGSDIPSMETVWGVLRRYGLREKGYILFVGAIEPKKNVGRLIDAYVSLDTDKKLVIVGKRGWLWEGEIGKIEGLLGKNWSDKIKLLNYVTTRDLKSLYAGAYCLVFPSLYEGFGLPPLEAMTLGCPVITSNVSSLPEVCGDAALYVDPYDVSDIKKKMEDMLNFSPQRWARFSKAGKERANLFSMENYVKRLYEAYSKVL